MAGEFFEPNKAELSRAVAVVAHSGADLQPGSPMFEATSIQFEDDLTEAQLAQAGARELYGQVKVRKRLPLAAGLVTFPSDRPPQIAQHAAYADLGALCATGLVTISHDSPGPAPLGEPRLSLWYNWYEGGHVLIDGEYRSLGSRVLVDQARRLWRTLLLYELFDLPPATDQSAMFGGLSDPIPVGPDQAAAFTFLVRNVSQRVNPLA